MPPKTRSSNTNLTKDELKQAMAPNGRKPSTGPQTPLDTDDQNHKLLLDIMANQKTFDEKRETQHRKLTSTITAHKQSLDNHIEENDKALGVIRGNVTTNTNDISSLQDSVKKPQTDLTAMQIKYDATQKLLDDASANFYAYAATINKLDVKYVKDEEELLRYQLIIDGVKDQGTRSPK